MHYTVLTAPDFPYADDVMKANIHSTPPPITEAERNKLHDRFERDMNNLVDALMEPYDEATENPDYLVFEDRTEEVLSGYKTGTLDCARMPGGRIVATYDHIFYKRFTVEDGIVYQRGWGPLRHNKRTRRAKQIKYLPEYPVRKLYKSVDAYADALCGCAFSQEHQAYGYMTNPDGYYDWYQIGGRWPLQLLIRDDDPYYMLGEKSWAVGPEVKQAPQGYRWVTGARKSAIQWDMMKEIEVEQSTAIFHQLEQWFITGVQPEEKRFAFAQRNEKGIFSWDGTLYEAGMTLEQYLRARGLAPDQRMLPGTYYILRDGDWVCADAYEKENQAEGHGSWAQFIAEYLDTLPDNAVLLSIDCHQ